MINTIEKKEIDLLEYWHVILKRKWILVTFSVVLLVFTAVYSLTSTRL